MTGEASLQFGPIASWTPLLAQGRGRAIAITSRQRIPTRPDLPSVAESGYPGYESGNWYGLLVPVKTPRETVVKIRDLTARALQRPEAKKRLESLAYVIAGNQPDGFAAFIRSEIEKTAKILKQTGVPPR